MALRGEQVRLLGVVVLVGAILGCSSESPPSITCGAIEPDLSVSCHADMTTTKLTPAGVIGFSPAAPFLASLEAPCAPNTGDPSKRLDASVRASCEAPEVVGATWRQTFEISGRAHRVCRQHEEGSDARVASFWSFQLALPTESQKVTVTTRVVADPQDDGSAGCSLTIGSYYAPKLSRHPIQFSDFVPGGPLDVVLNCRDVYNDSFASTGCVAHDSGMPVGPDEVSKDLVLTFEAQPEGL